jgi:hypothetical protein
MARKRLAQYTRQEISDLCGKHGLALCGFAPFGDCRSIRIRLDMARAQIASLTATADSWAEVQPDEPLIKSLRREAAAWQYAVSQGEALLARELAK